MLRRSVTGYSKVENVGQNSSAKYPQQVKQFWRASVTDLLFKSFLFSFFFFPPSFSLHWVQMIPFLQQLRVSFHTCVLFRKMLFVFLYGAGFQDQVFLSPAWMKNPLQMGYLRTESQASGLKMNVHLILNTTFLIVARKVKNHPLEFQFLLGLGHWWKLQILQLTHPLPKWVPKIWHQVCGPAEMKDSLRTGLIFTLTFKYFGEWGK